MSWLVAPGLMIAYMYRGVWWHTLHWVQVGHRLLPHQSSGETVKEILTLFRLDCSWSIATTKRPCSGQILQLQPVPEVSEVKLGMNWPKTFQSDVNYQFLKLSENVACQTRYITASCQIHTTQGHRQQRNKIFHYWNLRPDGAWPLHRWPNLGKAQGSALPVVSDLCLSGTAEPFTNEIYFIVSLLLVMMKFTK